MKTNRNTSFAAINKDLSLFAFPWRHMLRVTFATLILMLSAMLPQQLVPAVLVNSPPASRNGGIRQWSVQVDKIDPGDVTLDASFGAAIYENLLQELTKANHFKQVFRGGDRNANDVPALLILRTRVQKYTRGSETRRAVTTVTGATKLKVRIQVFTREGNLVLEHLVDGNVRFIGSNMGATHNLAHNVAATLKRSTLPEPNLEAPEQVAGKMSQYQVGTITAVKDHTAAAGADPSVTSYEISVRVGSTVYVVLYTPPLGADSAKYLAGRDLLVLAGENTITYNDMLGNSLQVPIISRTTAASPSNSR
jgi:hypothetical protein